VKEQTHQGKQDRKTGEETKKGNGQDKKKDRNTRQTDNERKIKERME